MRASSKDGNQQNAPHAFYRARTVGVDIANCLCGQKEGQFRFGIDHWKLNAVTVKGEYPNPRIDQCLDSLNKGSIFSTLNANFGLLENKIDETARDKTGFTSHHGLYGFIPMTLVLKCSKHNSESYGRHTIDRQRPIRTHVQQPCHFSRTVEDHLYHLPIILKLLSRAAVSLKLKKCIFFEDCNRNVGLAIQLGRLGI